MIVSPQEYNSLLASLKDPKLYMSYLRIPKDEPIYDIDLDKRIINAPTFLSVEEDHNSEIIWFRTDRFYDNIDLYDGACWIQYQNANKNKFYYSAPLLVEAQEEGHDKILIPWAISNDVADKTGQVEFAFQFFKLSEDGLRFHYVLNTQVAKSKILSTLRIDPLGEIDDKEEHDAITDELHKLTAQIEALRKLYDVYWINVE